MYIYKYVITNVHSICITCLYVYIYKYVIANVHSICITCLYIPGGDNLVKGVQCYELFGGIALKNHTFFIFIYIYPLYTNMSLQMCIVHA